MPEIKKVAVIGAGTMGLGIASLCAEAGCQVVMLDTSADIVAKAQARMSVSTFCGLDMAGTIRPRYRFGIR